MKHHLFVWGTNPQPFRSKADSSIVLPISVEEMARIGIPARKIPPRAGRIAAPDCSGPRAAGPQNGAAAGQADCG